MSIVMQKSIFTIGLSIAFSTNLLAAHNATAMGLAEKSVTIYAAGDIADCRKLPAADTPAAKTAELIATRLADDKSAAVLTVGDHTYPVGVLSEFYNCYDKTWGQFKARTHPAPGNHEYYTPEAIGYYSYFREQNDSSRRSYYSFKIGKWHVISLNSNLKEDAYAAQLAWLKNDLSQHPTKCALAYWHHPVFSSGGHGNNDFMKETWKALEAANVDVVLSGHDHDYERFAPQNVDGQRDDAHGIREFIVGTGGAYLTPMFLRKENSEISNNSTYGVLKMILKENSYEWEFLPVPGSTFTDHGTGECH
jgi:acid phosphatase type 7